MKKLILYLTISLLFLPSYAFDQKLTHTQKEFSQQVTVIKKTDQILARLKQKIPANRPTTVGLLALSKGKNSVMLVLGREQKDQTWSDFGGKSEGNETVFAALQREVFEETSQMIKLNLNAIINDPAAILIHINKPKRDIYYLIHQISYFSPKDFSQNRKKMVDEHYLEKDKIQWVDLDFFIAFSKHLQSKKSEMPTTAQFKTSDDTILTLRKYFVADVVENQSITVALTESQNMVNSHAMVNTAA